MADHRYVFGEDASREEERLAAGGAGVRCAQPERRGRGGLGRRLALLGGRRGSRVDRSLAVDGCRIDGVCARHRLDDRWFDLGGSEVEFRSHDVVFGRIPQGGFDLVHARFLLEHLVDPRAAMARLAEALRPGGVLVLEDSAGLDVSVTPPTPVFDHLALAWERSGYAVAWKASYGSELLPDLRTIGLRELQGRQYRQLAPGGASWAHLAHGLRRLDRELLEHGVRPEHLAEMLKCLADPAKLITGPPITIAWGRR